MDDDRLTELLWDMDAEISVPQEVGAMWRGTVKKEFRAAKRRRAVVRTAQLLTICIIMLGVAGLFGVYDNGSTAMPAVPAIYAKANENFVFIEADGAVAEASFEAAQAEDDTELYVMYASAALRSNAPAECADAVQLLAEELGGYAQFRTAEGRTVTLTLRIQNDSVNGFMALLARDFKLRSAQTNMRTVDELYYDAESRLQTAYLSVERLEELISSANAEQLSDLYAQLAQLYDDIDELERTINGYDTDLNYATVTVTIEKTSVGYIAAAAAIIAAVILAGIITRRKAKR